LKRLAGYNITFDHGTPFPNALAQFVKTLEIPRGEAPSPHAQAVVDTRRAAAMENESTGRRMMEGHLLFYGEAHADGILGLTHKDRVNLVREYLPPPPRPTVPELWGTLPRPQPDSCIGHITATEAKTHNPPLMMPFSREEDGYLFNLSGMDSFCELWSAVPHLWHGFMTSSSQQHSSTDHTNL
jgi:hypothetical protein